MATTSSIPVELRPFTPARLAELTDMWVESWREAMPDIDFDARRSWFMDHLARLLAAGVVVELAFAAEDGSLAGFVTIDPRSGHVDQLAVRRSQWGRGIAEVLIRSAAAHAAGRALMLEVNEENARAVRFYRRIGFEVRGRSANPLSGRPTLQMEWPPDARPVEGG